MVYAVNLRDWQNRERVCWPKSKVGLWYKAEELHFLSSVANQIGINHRRS